MKGKVCDFNKWKRKEKFKEKCRRGWQKGKELGYKAIILVRENPWIIPVGIGAATLTGKVIQKGMIAHRVNKELHFKNTTIYDRSLGRYVHLKKPLTASQSVTIERRKANGEKLHTILDSMGLLKG